MITSIRMGKKTVFLLVNAALLLFIAGRGYSINADSYEYINHFIYRPPLYPLFLSTLGALFGQHFLIAAAVIQTAAIQASAAFFAHVMKNLLNIGEKGFLILFAACLLPLFDLFAKVGGLGNAIMSEGLSYAVLLCALAMLSKAVFARETKSAALFAALAVCSTWLRPQLAFLYPASLGLALLKPEKGTLPKKVLIIAAVMFALSQIGNHAQKAFHKALNGYSAAPSVTAQHMAGKMLYFSDEKEIAGLDLPVEDRATAILIWRELDRKKLLARHHPADNPAISVSAPLNDICWGTMAKVYRQTRCADCPPAQEYMSLNAFSARLGRKLLPMHGKKIIELSCREMLRRFDFMTLLFGAAFALCVFILKENRLSTIFALATTILAANCFAIEHFAAAAPRLYMYSNMTELLLSVIVLLEVARKRGLTGQETAPREK